MQHDEVVDQHKPLTINLQVLPYAPIPYVYWDLNEALTVHQLPVVRLDPMQLIALVRLLCSMRDIRIHL